MKNLAIGFSSIRPVQISEEICDAREEEYLKCLKQLKRVLPKSFDFLLCENTIDDPNQIKNDELKSFLAETEMCAMGSESNIGTSNKGLGELLQLKTALDQVNIDDYENISYVTTRGMYTNPYVFEKTENLEVQALLSNPDFVFLNGTYEESYKGELFNDMFFSMKSKLMLEYANYSMDKLDYLSINHIGSEYNLYNFVKENNVSYETIEWLGRIRNDWSRSNSAYNIDNFHFC